MTDQQLLKETIRRRDRYQCSYCGVRDERSEFGLDHFYPKTKYPNLADDPDNLVLACATCNSAKGDVDPADRLLNPRIDAFTEHIADDLESGLVGARTARGEYTIALLRLNRPALVTWRKTMYVTERALADALLRVVGLMDEALSNIHRTLPESAEKRRRLIELYRQLLDLAPLPEQHDSDGHLVRIEAIHWDQVGKELTPYVMSYLKNNPYDLAAVDPLLFERIVAEYFASIGCTVTLLGQDPTTGADVMAVQKDDHIGVEVRYLIEVKRWKDKVGIEVIDRVLGTFTREKPNWGWDKIIIVSRAGFKQFRGTDEDRLKLIGINLKGREDIATYLRSYKPRPDGGLWLPRGWDAIDRM